MARYRERPDYLNEATNLQLIERYRFDREGILYLDANLNHILKPKTRRNNSFSSLEKIIVTLRYLATGHIQLNNADIHGIRQPSVSRIVNEVTQAFCKPEVISRYVHMPATRQRVQEIKNGFFQVAGFPNVVGLIDGTHIPIKAPVEDEPAYVNRMSYHSINTQVI